MALRRSFSSVILSTISLRAFLGSLRTSGKSARRLCAGPGELAEVGLAEEEAREVAVGEAAEVVDDAAPLDLVAAVAGGAVALGGVVDEDACSIGAALAGGAVALGGLGNLKILGSRK